MEIEYTKIIKFRMYEGKDLLFGAFDILDAIGMYEDCEVNKMHDDVVSFLSYNIYFNPADIQELDDHNMYSVNDTMVVATDMKLAIKYYIILENERRKIKIEACDVTDVKFESMIYMCPIRSLKQIK
jgi:hypothetical protein